MELNRHQLKAALRLYLVTDQACLNGHSLTDMVQAAVQGGVTCVQLREKQLNTRDFYAQAVALLRLLEPLGVPLIINDRIDIALACGAQGVHLGQTDLAPDVARRLLPPEMVIGWSVETMADVERSATAPLDYIGISPVFATPTKTDTLTPWGLDGLRSAAAVSALPLIAIGGIRPDNAAAVLAAGADGLAVVSAICASPDPEATAQQFRRLLDGA